MPLMFYKSCILKLDKIPVLCDTFLKFRYSTEMFGQSCQTGTGPSFSLVSRRSTNMGTTQTASQSSPTYTQHWMIERACGGAWIIHCSVHMRLDQPTIRTIPTSIKRLGTRLPLISFHNLLSPLSFLPLQVVMICLYHFWDIFYDKIIAILEFKTFPDASWFFK